MMKGVKIKDVQIKHDWEVKHGTVYGDEEAEVLLQVLSGRAPSCGPRVVEFQEAFAAYCGTDYALAVTSATTGLSLAAIAVGVEPGDEVITTPLSWIATATAFSALGAKVRFCDVDSRTLNMDPQALERLITPRTRAIVPVHLYGQCCDMEAINRIAKSHGIPVIDDCAHAPGATFQSVKTGALANISVFSFQQQKNLSTLGEGGMVTTSNREYYERVLSYRSLCCRTYGGSDKYLAIDESKYPMNKKYWELQFDDIGFNYRMTDAQAAVGTVQLRKLDEFNARRQEIAEKITDVVNSIGGISPPFVDPRGTHVFHLYMFQLDESFPVGKVDLMWRLYNDYGIKAWSHYLPIHLTRPYRDRGHAEGECPVTEEVVKRHVVLPIHPRLTDEALDYLKQSIWDIIQTTEGT